VKEKRYAHSSCFIEAEKLIVLLHDLAARIGTASGEHGYGDKQAVRLENGWKALDYWKPTSASVRLVSKAVWKNKG
jgi:hypothetical protein